MKRAVLVITVPLLAKEGLGEVDYDPGLPRRGNERQKGHEMTQRKIMHALIAIVLFLPGLAFAQQNAEGTLAAINKLPPLERQRSLTEGAKKEKELMVYTVLTLTDFDHLQRAFNRKYPYIRVNRLRMGGGKLFDIALNEHRAGRHLVDVFTAGESSTYPLIKAGVGGRYLSPERQAFAPEYKDRDGYWIAYFAYRWVFGYNTGLVPPDRLPKTYFDLLDPYWKGKLALDTDPHSWMVGIIKAYGKEKAVDYFKALARQGLRLHKGRTLRAQLMAAGEFPASMEQEVSKMVQMKRQGAPLDYRYLENTPSTLTPVALARFTSHPHAAALYIDFVLSEEGQKLLAELAYVPLRRGVRPKDAELAERDAQAKLVPLNTESTFSWRDEVIELADQIFTRGRR
ncbi:MAG: extracellular solute-binding protein [Deltaproteobacteria bacterium]|nr:extracellular solute-binding protein [Deltaproteobacteria bacterium]